MVWEEEYRNTVTFMTTHYEHAHCQKPHGRTQRLSQEAPEDT